MTVENPLPENRTAMERKQSDNCYDSSLAINKAPAIRSFYAFPGLKPEPVVIAKAEVKAEEITSFIMPEALTGRSPSRILSIIHKHTGITIAEIESKSRKRPIVEARQYASFFLRYFTGLTLKKIGMILGGRDHSTVLHNNDALRDMIDTEAVGKEFYKIMKEVKELKPEESIVCTSCNGTGWLLAKEKNGP